jgi:hypothetical protein
LGSGEERTVVIQLHVQPGAAPTVDLFNLGERNATSWKEVSSAAGRDQVEDQTAAGSPDEVAFNRNPAYDEKLNRLRTLLGE